MSNLLVDPVAFLLLNNIPPPHHWDVNITHVSHRSPLHVSMSNVSDYRLDTSDTVSTWSGYTWLLTSTPGLFGLVPGVANPTGVTLLIVLSIMVICSMKWVRKSGNFEVHYIREIHVKNI